MNEQRPLPNGWRLSEPYPESKQSGYVKRMVEEISAIPRIKREGPKTWNGKPVELLTQEEREEFYFSQQPESTKQALLKQKTRRPEEDIDHLLRPMPACVANPEAKNLAELTATRHLEPSDVMMERGLKNGRNALGQSIKGSVEGEKRDRGIQAFTYSKPANPSDEDLKRLAKLNQLEAVVPEEAPKQEQQPQRPWWKFWLPKKREFDPDRWDLHDSTTWRDDDAH